MKIKRHSWILLSLVDNRLLLPIYLIVVLRNWFQNDLKKW